MTDLFDEVITHRELADFLGVSERSLYAYRIPRISLGKQRLYFKTDVAQWLRSRQEAQR